METALFTLAGTIVGGLITFLLQHQRYTQELKMLRETHKTEFIAESTAKHFLNHKSFTDRSFETLQKHLGGFEEDELRKILVRAGAIRTYRDDGSEWWRLLSRMDEFISNKQQG
jgi:patatin-like phospholipase/acyl hydrolase